MSETVRLSDEHKKLLLDLSVTFGRTADEMLSEEYEEISPDHARGFLECFFRTAPEDKVLLAYFVLRMLQGKA